MNARGTIRAVIADEAIDKVSRLFDGSVDQILLELYQNAQRAGARRVRVWTEQKGDVILVTVADDGHGCPDPAVTLAFGRSAWPAGWAAAGEPAGMGLYALARTRTTLRSIPTDEKRRPWRVDLGPEHFAGRADAVIRDLTPSEAAAMSRSGMSVTFETPTGTTRDACAEAARRIGSHHAPTAMVEDEEVARAHIGDGSIWSESSADGRYRFHVLEGVSGREKGEQLDWASVRVGGLGFEPVRLVDTMHGWSDLTLRVVAEVLDGRGLEAVLPQRRQVTSDNAGVQALRSEAMTALYKGVLARLLRPDGFEAPRHVWTSALEHGVELPASEPVLPRWRAARTWGSPGSGVPVHIRPEKNSVTARYGLAGLERVDEIMLEEAVSHDDGLTIVARRDEMLGYAWYDELPILTDAELRIRLRETDGMLQRELGRVVSDELAGGAPAGSDNGGQADRAATIEIGLTFTAPDGSEFERTVPTGWAVRDPAAPVDELDDQLLVSARQGPTPMETGILEGLLLEAYERGDGNDGQTIERCRQAVTTRRAGRKEGLRMRLAGLAAEHLCDEVPAGTVVTIRLEAEADRKDIRIDIEEQADADTE